MARTALSPELPPTRQPAADFLKGAEKPKAPKVEVTIDTDIKKPGPKESFSVAGLKTALEANQPPYDVLVNFDSGQLDPPAGQKAKTNDASQNFLDNGTNSAPAPAENPTKSPDADDASNVIKFPDRNALDDPDSPEVKAIREEMAKRAAQKTSGESDKTATSSTTKDAQTNIPPEADAEDHVLSQEEIEAREKEIEKKDVENKQRQADQIARNDRINQRNQQEFDLSRKDWGKISKGDERFFIESAAEGRQGDKFTVPAQEYLKREQEEKAKAEREARTSTAQVEGDHHQTASDTDEKVQERNTPNAQLIAAAANSEPAGRAANDEIYVEDPGSLDLTPAKAPQAAAPDVPAATAEPTGDSAFNGEDPGLTPKNEVPGSAGGASLPDALKQAVHGTRTEPVDETNADSGVLAADALYAKLTAASTAPAETSTEAAPAPAAEAQEPPKAAETKEPLTAEQQTLVDVGKIGIELSKSDLNLTDEQFKQWADALPADPQKLSAIAKNLKTLNGIKKPEDKIIAFNKLKDAISTVTGASPKPGETETTDSTPKTPEQIKKEEQLKTMAEIGRTIAEADPAKQNEILDHIARNPNTAPESLTILKTIKSGDTGEVATMRKSYEDRLKALEDKLKDPDKEEQPEEQKKEEEEMGAIQKLLMLIAMSVAAAGIGISKISPER